MLDNPEIRIVGSVCVLRSLREGDIDDLVALANNPRVSASLRDVFPYPYTHADAHSWLNRLKTADETSLVKVITLAITEPSTDRFIGSITALPGDDVYRFTRTLGYWLGEPYWGKGIVTEAVKMLCDYVLAEFPEVIRLEAVVYADNQGSAKVLEKAGFVLEGISKNGAVKRFGKLRPTVLLSDPWPPTDSGK